MPHLPPHADGNLRTSLGSYFERRHGVGTCVSRTVNQRKSGIVNLGAEGMMLCAAIAGFAAVSVTGNDLLGFMAGITAGAVMASYFWFFCDLVEHQPICNRLALSLFGAGFSAFVGVAFVQAKLPERVQYVVPFLSVIPWLGTALFRQHPLVYGAAALAIGLSWFLYRTRLGLVLRAVGESPHSSHALGFSVRKVRFLAVMAGGALCGLSGAYISIIYTPLWVEGMIAGKGWIALALTTFATWRPARVLWGAYLFGGVTMLQFHLQASGVDVPSQFFEHVALYMYHCGAVPYFAKSQVVTR
jgi:general nucleoside transport system permease protein